MPKELISIGTLKPLKWCFEIVQLSYPPSPSFSALKKTHLQNLLKIEVFSQISSTWMMMSFLSCYFLHLKTGRTLQFLQPPEKEAGPVQK